MADDFIHIQATAANLGLILNCSKCEIVGHTVESRDHFISKGILFPETDTQETVFLGSPLFEGSCLNKTLSAKRAESSLITKRLTFMPSHESPFLLCFVIAMPRQLYTLRTAPRVRETRNYSRYICIILRYISRLFSTFLTNYLYFSL